MNNFKRDINKFIGEHSRFNESLKQNILMKIKEDNKPKLVSRKRGGIFKHAAILTLLLSFVTFFLIQNLHENEQEAHPPTTAKQEISVLTDSDTVPEIDTFSDYEEPLKVFDFKSDAMDRGNHEYAAYPLLIDPLAYNTEDISRGDVVVYEYEFSNGIMKTVSRIVGLPGESIEILDGQIFIDGRKLETFYGKAHRAGTSSSAEYKTWFEKNTSSNSTSSGLEDIFHLEMEQIKLAEDEVFLVGDDWFRGSRHSVEIADLEGKVIGYYKE